MATQDDVRAIAKTLPGAIEAADHFAFSVENKGKAKGFAWVWLERLDPKKARVPQPKVLAVRVANEIAKAALLSADADKFFTEPHYHGYPAVLVRLAEVTVPELQQVLTEAWRCMAPRAVVAAYDAESSAPPAAGRGAGGKARGSTPAQGRGKAGQARGKAGQARGKADPARGKAAPARGKAGQARTSPSRARTSSVKPARTKRTR